MVVGVHHDVSSLASDASNALIQLLTEPFKWGPANLSCVLHAHVRSVIFVEPN